MEQTWRGTGEKVLREGRKFINGGKPYGFVVKSIEASGVWSVGGISNAVLPPGTRIRTPLGWHFATTDDTHRARFEPTAESVLVITIEHISEVEATE